MTTLNRSMLAGYERDYGVVLPTGTRSLEELAMDAQPATFTTANGGIPAWMANYVDPTTIQVLFSPIKAAVIMGEAKKGDWTTLTAQFPISEAIGHTSAYGDYNNNGNSGANFNWVPREQFYFQTVTQWGERELALAGQAYIDYATSINNASVQAINRFQNKSYFYGVQGLQNFGLLNDPSLSAAITPATKAAGGTSWVNATPKEVFDDFKSLFAQLVKQTGGLVDMETPMVAGLSPTSQVYLSNVNDLMGMNAITLIKAQFPNLRIETAVEYTTDAGEFVQLIAESIEGQDTGYTAFSEKLRAHPVVTDLSSFRQKKSAGTWGTIIRMPIGVASMVGV